MWRYLNKNPKARNVNDCVIRSISTAEDKSWGEVYDELSLLAREQGIILDDVKFVEPYLDSKYERILPKYHPNGMTVGEFMYKNPYHIYLITVNSHIVCVRFGVLYDTWDSRNEKIRNVWIVDKR